MSLLSALRNALNELNCVSGSVHVRNGNCLELRAHLGLPSSVIPLIETIPKGKGMAGQAWYRGEPVSTCNLKGDTLAPIRPGARAVDAQSAVALPIMSKAGSVIGVVGFAARDNCGFDMDRLDQCQEVARRIIVPELSPVSGDGDRPTAEVKTN